MFKRKKKGQKNTQQVHYNEYDYDPRKQYLAEKKAKKLKRRQRLILTIIIVIMVVAYFASPISKVSKVEISGNDHVHKEDIEEALHITKDTTLLFMNTSKLEKKIGKISLVKKATVTRNILGTVNVEIEEASPVAYAIFKKKTYVIDEVGHVGLVNHDDIKERVKNTPQLLKFKSLDAISSFAKQYVTLPYILRNSVSDVIFSPKDADPTRVRFILDNGKELYVRLEDIGKVLQTSKFDYEAYMTEYKDICVFSFEGDSIYMKKCNGSQD